MPLAVECVRAVGHVARGEPVVGEPGAERLAALERELIEHPIEGLTVLEVSGCDTQVEVHGRWQQRIQTHRLRAPMVLDGPDDDDPASPSTSEWATSVRWRLDEGLSTGVLVWGVRAEATRGVPVIDVSTEADRSPRGWSIAVGMPEPLGGRVQSASMVGTAWPPVWCRPGGSARCPNEPTPPLECLRP